MLSIIGANTYFCIRNLVANATKKRTEVDFVCNLGSRRYYIQSAYRMETEEKEVQEKISLLNIDDSFKKIIITGEPSVVHRDNNGITTISIYDFLLNANSLEM